ncbi:allophanate hydrolase [Saccharomonospora sp. CUA-673]|uniref:5-oxoprolinase subunit C family protein n=1 Tax=Saccharomonospora sp. CUA-673 TaxID=1904969 RepID=UPI0009640B7D|nr:biotin-dependent carboxyltransferase family protein [Saccharomonospora sp. CUA-673]OLT45904.1 allophanate hydrolase [Saccharomonospora sp. CUA-673]
MSDLLVRSGGLYTTVQDTGRFGYYHTGMPPSGAMDAYAAVVANLLVGNPDGAGVLEGTYIGPTLEFTDERLVAVTGADVPVTVNDEPVEPWTAVRVGPGDVLAFAMIRAGCRAYVAVSGGVDVPVYLGSRSTYTLTGIGGHHGRKLVDDETLPLGAATGSGRAGAAIPQDLQPDLSAPAELRTVIGLCSYRLTEEALASFLDTDWKVTKDADRVGYRLRGGRLDFTERQQPFGAGSDPANVVDLGYPVGSIQVPGGDEPIVLLNDAVTGGGYATIGTVISVDRDRIAQTKTGDTVRFTSVDLDTALAARRDRRERIERVRRELAR